MIESKKTALPRAKDRRTEPPLEPGFFTDVFEQPAKKKNTVIKSMPRLRDLHPDDLEDYYELFVLRCDRRAYNTKRGYWDAGDFDNQAQDWRPKIKRNGKESGSPYVPATKDIILDDLERHLDTTYWRRRGHRAKGWQQPFFVGTLGGQFSAAFHYDIDNHGGDRIRYTRNGGNYRVPDLSVGFLRLVRRVMSLPFEAYGLRPTNLTTSSDSLGLYLWFLPDIPMTTAEGHASLRKLADDHGMVKLEAYPVPALQDKGPYEGRSVSRLPCGHGSVSLTAGGIIRDWRAQVRNFIEPGPLPTFPQVVEQLLGLWLELHESWMPGFLERTTPRLGHYERRTDEILSWLSEGCPSVAAAAPEAQVVEEEFRRAGKKSCPTSVSEAGLPDGWGALPYPDKLYTIATRGCPAEGMLNTCLIMIVRHLMQYELNDCDEDEKEEVAFRVCEHWALEKHHGCSGRLSHGDTSLPRNVASVISRNIRSVSCGGQTVGGRNSLRLRDLITGEGPPNGYVPRVETGGGGMDLLSVYTFDSPSISGNDYQQAERRIIETIGAGIYDHETIRSVEGRIVHAKPAFQKFARRLSNYLMTKPEQTARIHTKVFMALADTSSPTTMTKYKKAALDERIIKVVSHKFRIGGQSKLYQLHPLLCPSLAG